MSMHLPTHRVDLDAVRDAHPIVEVLGRMGVAPELRGAADQRRFRVPAAALGFGRHDDDPREVLIDPATPSRCWSDAHDNRGGDVVALVSSVTGMTQRESVAVLGLGGPITVAARVVPAAPLADNTVAARGAFYDIPVLGRTPVERVRAVNAEAWRFYTSSTLAGRARAYLSDQGIDSSGLAALERAAGAPLAGRTPLGSVGLVEHLRLVGFTDTDAIDAGWAQRTRQLDIGPGFRREHGQVVDRFRNRVLVPFTSVSGEVVGVAGRAVSWFPGARHQKYLFHPRTAVFDRSRAEYLPAGREVGPRWAETAADDPLEILARVAAAATD